MKVFQIQINNVLQGVTLQAYYHNVDIAQERTLKLQNCFHCQLKSHVIKSKLFSSPVRPWALPLWSSLDHRHRSRDSALSEYSAASVSLRLSKADSKGNSKKYSEEGNIPGINGFPKSLLWKSVLLVPTAYLWNLPSCQSLRPPGGLGSREKHRDEENRHSRWSVHKPPPTSGKKQLGQPQGQTPCQGPTP